MSYFAGTEKYCYPLTSPVVSNGWYKGHVFHSLHSRNFRFERHKMEMQMSVSRSIPSFSSINLEICGTYLTGHERIAVNFTLFSPVNLRWSQSIAFPFTFTLPRPCNLIALEYLYLTHYTGIVLGLFRVFFSLFFS